jgi:uncharacterized protein (TIGR02611 family)
MGCAVPVGTMRQTVPMSAATRIKGWFRRTGSEALGWVLVPLGIIMMPAPGPGTLVLVSGIALLSRHYVWAQKLLDPLERRAIEAAKFGVATWPRILLSVIGVLWLVVLGVIWWVEPEIPEFEVLGVGFGPQLPAAGWGTALGLWASAVAALGLLIYSIIKWREPRHDPTDSGVR